MGWRGPRVAWGLAGASALLVTVSAAAFACTNLASINLSSTFGKPGDAIVITGSGFSGGVEGAMDGMDMSAMDMAAGSMGTTTALAVRPPVIIRWNGPDGLVLTSAIPDRTGSISVTINIPDELPGHYALVAVQKNHQGYDVYGTPARAPFQITSDGNAPREPASGRVAGTGDSNASGIVLLTVALGAVGLGMFAAGGIAVAHQLGRRKVPAAARAHRG